MAIIILIPNNIIFDYFSYQDPNTTAARKENIINMEKVEKPMGVYYIRQTSSNKYTANLNTDKLNNVTNG